MRFLKGLEWPTVSMLAACYGSWAVAGLVLWPQWPVVALIVMAIASALHSSLQHEALHGHPTRSAAINELLVSVPLGVFYPYRRFKQLHLRHHDDERLTDPYDDPESWYRSAATWGGVGGPLRLVLAVNNTLAGRLILGPALMITAFLAQEPGRLWRGERDIRRAWLNHLVGVAVLIAIVQGLMGINFAVYLIAVAYPSMSIIAIRTYCEHQWADSPEGRTVIVERGGILGALFLNNNLHFVHHKRPCVAWYELPVHFRAERDNWLAANGGYAFRSYQDIARHFAFHAKEPVVHPAWRLEAEPVVLQGPAVHPAGPATGPSIGCASVVPAKPDRA
jgi:fatty acid desaturase